LKIFTQTIQSEFLRHKNLDIAVAQKQYMKQRFEFYGIKAPLRKEIQRPFFLKMHLPSKKEMHNIVQELWLKPQRELHYFTQELVQKYIKQFEKNEIDLLEFMVVNKSWWDTVDHIASNLIGPYFKKFPEQKMVYIEKWLNSNNFWLQRSAILFQLKYKKDLDEVLLSKIINRLLGSKEFFINKAIGWILREYSKVNPIWVIDFVKKTPLNNMSRREALRLIK
jgi:3-methyladenine DNA glycosylase AlkD